MVGGGGGRLFLYTMVPSVKRKRYWPVLNSGNRLSAFLCANTLLIGGTFFKVCTERRIYFKPVLRDVATSSEAACGRLGARNNLAYILCEQSDDGLFG